jgi:hypothetical protein
MKVSPMIRRFSSGSVVWHKNLVRREVVVPSGPFSVITVSPFKSQGYKTFFFVADEETKYAFP